jgi:hypothetical protein
MLCLKVAEVLFAGAAAGLWFTSAIIKTPNSFRIIVNSLFDPEMPVASSPELTTLANTLRRQSHLSASAAACAGGAATLQAVSLILAN